MDFERNLGGRSPLEQRPVPRIVPEQLKKFELEFIDPRMVARFNPKLEEGARVIGIDIAADGLSARELVVVNSRLLPANAGWEHKNSFNGAGYLDKLRDIARHAVRGDIPVGISFAGPLNNTLPDHGENVGIFVEELAAHYEGDFASLFPTLKTVANDAIAGLWAASLDAYQQHKAQDVIYVINDGGMNASFLRNGILHSMEAGHIEVVPQLNPQNQQKLCWFHGSKRIVCVESVAASKVGIEDLLVKAKGRQLTHDEIEAQYFAGDALTTELYDNSANVAAHMVQGIADAMRMDLSSQLTTTAVVCHGEAFRFPGYGARMRQILEEHVGQPVNLYTTAVFSDNASLNGAALAALSK